MRASLGDRWQRGSFVSEKGILMFYTRRAILALVVVACTVAVAMAQPNVTTMSGKIQEVDATTSRFTLRAPEGTLTAFQAPPGFLATLQPGDAVEVMMAGSNAMIIRKQDEAAPSAGVDMRPRPPPDGMEETPTSDERRPGP